MENPYAGNIFVSDGRTMPNDEGPVTREEHFRRLNAWHHSESWKKNYTFDFDSLVGQRWEITKEVYWEFLEVLPPIRWRGAGSDLESFYISEPLSGNIHSMYSRHGSGENARYYHERARLL